MKPCELAFTVSARDVSAFADHHARRSRIVAGARRVHHFLWPAAFLALGHVLRLRTGNVLAFIPFVVAAAAWILAFPWLLRSAYRRQVLNACQESGSALGARTLRAGPDGLCVAAGGEERRIEWGAVREVAETRRHIFIYVGEARALVIPKRAVGGDGARRLLESLEEGRAGKP